MKESSTSRFLLYSLETFHVNILHTHHTWGRKWIKRGESDTHLTLSHTVLYVCIKKERERKTRYVERRPGISYYLIRLSHLSLHISFSSLSLPLSKYHSLSKFTTTSNTARMRLYQWMSGSFINFSNYLSILSFFHISFSFSFFLFQFSLFLFRFSPLISTQQKFFPLLSLTHSSCLNLLFLSPVRSSSSSFWKRFTEKMEGKAGKLWRVEGKKRREREKEIQRAEGRKKGWKKERIK